MAYDADALTNGAVAGATALVTHLTLTYGGTEVAVTRKAVSWATPSGGVQAPTLDLTFTIPTGVTVDGWQGRRR